jgi:hypothetical protein
MRWAHQFFNEVEKTIDKRKAEIRVRTIVFLVARVNRKGEMIIDEERETTKWRNLGDLENVYWSFRRVGG